MRRGALIVWWSYGHIGARVMPPQLCPLWPQLLCWCAGFGGTTFFSSEFPERFSLAILSFSTFTKHLVLCAQLCSKCHYTGFSIKRHFKPAGGHHQFLKPRHLKPQRIGHDWSDGAHAICEGVGGCFVFCWGIGALQCCVSTVRWGESTICIHMSPLLNFLPV